MANTIIKIGEKKVNGDWCNITTIDLKEVSINLKSNPKTSALIDEGKTEIEVNLIDKNGKLYGWDKQEAKQGGGSPFKQLSPEQLAAKQAREDHTQRMIVAQNSVTNATHFVSSQNNAGIEEIKKYAKELYNLVMEISK